MTALLLAACQKSAPPQPSAAHESLAQPAPAAPPTAAATPAPSEAERELRASQFLVLQEEGPAIVLESSREPGSSTLVESADGALYQADLGLLWYRDEGRLYVLDLRGLLEGGKLDAKPVLIASGLPDEADQLSIARGASVAQDETGCESGSIKLSWTRDPSVRAYLTGAPELRLENARWLQEQLERPRVPAGRRTSFEDAREHVRLPKKLQDCMDPESCGASVPFGARGWELVLVIERPGGDCIQRACLLRDPKTSRFAAPPQARAWGAARKTALGSCGPYRFDHAQLSFLTQDQLCSPERGCRALQGIALGWLLPGDTIGAPGASPSADSAD